MANVRVLSPEEVEERFGVRQPAEAPKPSASSTPRILSESEAKGYRPKKSDSVEELLQTAPPGPVTSFIDSAASSMLGGDFLPGGGGAPYVMGFGDGLRGLLSGDGFESGFQSGQQRFSDRLETGQLANPTASQYGGYAGYAPPALMAGPILGGARAGLAAVPTWAKAGLGIGDAMNPNGLTQSVLSKIYGILGN